MAGKKGGMATVSLPEIDHARALLVETARLLERHRALLGGQSLAPEPVAPPLPKPSEPVPAEGKPAASSWWAWVPSLW